MADFRKWVLVLAVLALAVSANAQGPLSCTTQSGGVSTLVRSEGIAELVGDIVLTCSGSTPGPIFANIQIFLNTTVSSRGFGTLGKTESLLTLGNSTGEPGTAALPYIVGANTFQGTTVGGLTQSLLWANIPIATAAEPVSTTRVIRITNVRANANAIPSGPGLPGTVQALVTITGSQSIPLLNPQVTVAGVIPGLRDVSLRKAGADSDSYSAKTLQQCVGQNTDLAGDPTKSGSITYQIRYREAFPSAFRPIGGAAGLLGAPPDVTSDPINGTPGGGQTLLNKAYFTESGVTPAGSPNLVGTLDGGAGVGQATQGTRFFARFANVPAGVRIFVTTGPTLTEATGTDTTVKAVLVGFDPAAGGVSANPVKPTALTTGTADSLEITEVTLVGGTGSAVWEVTQANGNGTEKISFGVVVAFPKNLTLTTTPSPTSTVAGSFAPISTVTTVSTTAPAPRFADTSSAMNAFTVAACVSNLLFPYVTNQAGFDTGVAIINTSLDNATGSSGTPPNQPFKTTPQHGTCTVYYFGAMASGGQLPPPQTTVDIAAGQMVAFALSQGGVPGDTSGSAAGFQGYLIVRCNFQYAHGFAFVSDLGANRLSHGYLALVLPDRTRVAEPFSSATTGGEQLVN